MAAHAATRPVFPLATVAAELRETSGGLRGLGADDAATDLETVFSWSYHALSDRAATLFRLMGLHPGADATTRTPRGSATTR